ncbi:MAG: DNA polymerase III subunit gamma/tau, partial [Acutalibacteraceae bacterium]
ESGNYLLIDSPSDIPFKLLKQSVQRENIKKSIEEVTGKRYNLGPYKKPKKEAKKEDPLNSFIENLKDSGINISIEE